MKILRLTILSSTLAVAIFTLGYANPSFADNPNKGDCSPGHCDHGDDDPTEMPAEYEAALTMGGFTFEPLTVTPNKRKNAYHGEDPVDMSRSVVGDSGQMAWDNVFGTCSALLTSLIDGVTAGDNWTINISGSKLNGSVSNNPDSDILIRFRDVVADNFPDVDIDFNLIGKIGLTNNNVTNFLPEELNDTSSFMLDTFNFFASGSQGGGCRSGIVLLYTPSVLKITRTK